MKKLSLMLVVLALVAFADPYKHVGDVSKLGNFHERVTDFKPFAIGEKLDYRMHYGPVNAGTASLEVRKVERKIAGKEVYQLVGTGRSTGAFDWFFKVRDRYVSYVDAQTLNPYIFIRRVNEGGYIINRDYVFYQDQKMVKDKKHEEKIMMPENVQDILSAFYYARSIDFSKVKEGDIIKMYSYLDYEVWPLQVRYKGVEKVKVKEGTFECMRFVPVVQQGRIFEDEEDLNVWITNDKNRIPILAKADILVGSIKMEITGWKGLAHPLAKLD